MQFINCKVYFLGSQIASIFSSSAQGLKKASGNTLACISWEMEHQCDNNKVPIVTFCK
jgi:small neutral amino acid transporter SnatA (MarC family)